MDISMDQIQAIRGQQDEIDALPDREYIKTICSIMGKMLENPATRNLDFSTARELCKKFAEDIEVQLEQQASNIAEPEVEYDTDDENEFGESFVKEQRKPTLDEAKSFLRKKGYCLKG